MGAVTVVRGRAANMYLYPSKRRSSRLPDPTSAAVEVTVAWWAPFVGCVGFTGSRL